MSRNDTVSGIISIQLPVSYRYCIRYHFGTVACTVTILYLVPFRYRCLYRNDAVPNIFPISFTVSFRFCAQYHFGTGHNIDPISTRCANDSAIIPFLNRNGIVYWHARIVTDLAYSGNRYRFGSVTILACLQGTSSSLTVITPLFVGVCACLDARHLPGNIEVTLSCRAR